MNVHFGPVRGSQPSGMYVQHCQTIRSMPYHALNGVHTLWISGHPGPEVQDRKLAGVDDDDPIASCNLVSPKHVWRDVCSATRPRLR